MPALIPHWSADSLPQLPRHPGVAEPLGTRLEIRHDGACHCGRHRPVGVLLGMRSGARPRLEGEWFCRRNCLRQALEERARRDFPEDGRSTSRVRHRVPLGLMLQARGIVTTQQLQGALHMQAESGRRLGDILQIHFGVAEERITGAIAAQWGMPVLHLPPPSAMPIQNIAPTRLFQASGTFPVERTPTTMLLACSEGPDPALALALERMYPLRVEFGLVSSSVMEQWRVSHQESAVPVQRVRCAEREALAAEAADLLFQLQPVESRIVRVNGMWWMRIWLEDAARLQDGDVSGSDTLDVLFSLA